MNPAWSGSGQIWKTGIRILIEYGAHQQYKRTPTELSKRHIFRAANEDLNCYFVKFECQKCKFEYRMMLKIVPTALLTEL